jgi:hypothetical protein
VIDLIEDTTLAEEVDQLELSLDPNTAVLLRMEH